MAPSYPVASPTSSRVPRPDADPISQWLQSGASPVWLALPGSLAAKASGTAIQTPDLTFSKATRGITGQPPGAAEFGSNCVQLAGQPATSTDTLRAARRLDYRWNIPTGSSPVAALTADQLGPSLTSQVTISGGVLTNVVPVVLFAQHVSDTAPRSSYAATLLYEPTRATTRQRSCSGAMPCYARFRGGRCGGDPSMACKGSGVQIPSAPPQVSGPIGPLPSPDRPPEAADRHQRPLRRPIRRPPGVTAA